MLEKIEKRDGRIVEFDSSKITAAIAKAGNATGEFDDREARKLTLRVLTLAHEMRPGPTPEVEEVQDIVERVLLDTNGSRPKVLEKLIDEKLVDYIAMDLKTDPVLYRSYIKPDCGPDPILASIRILMESGIDYEFRTTCVKPIVTLETVENISHLIQGARLYALQRFRSRDVLHPEFFGGVENEFRDEELLQLKAVAEKRVKECIIR